MMRSARPYVGILTSLILAAGAHGESLDRAGELWAPLEWILHCPDVAGNPFDLEAGVTFRHAGGETRSTEMFHDGGTTWKFRFTATRTGEWTFVTKSEEPPLDAKEGTVAISAGGDAGPRRGFIVATEGNRWGRQTGEGGEVAPFVPQLVMGRDLPAYADNSKIDGDIQRWIVDHGFSGVHVGVLCRWFDIASATSQEIEAADPNPDPRTFEILEELIARFHGEGGMVHIWMWGDESRGMTPVKWGINGRADKRLHRYIAARLGPLPGWTMSYGFDLWEWVDGAELAAWHQSMHQHLGWPHLLGARWEKNELTQATEVLDYSSYEQHRPDYSTYVKTIERRPSKPSFSEDRYRVRDPSPYPDKDYDVEMTRRGLWHSAMAGGVANIWGYLVPSAEDGGSRPFPNREQIRTYATFFDGRFVPGLQRQSELTDGVALVSKRGDGSLALIYKEDTDSIRIEGLPSTQQVRAVAVDTKKAYREIPVSESELVSGRWHAPYASDWAMAIDRGAGAEGTEDD
ncbi:hypothetical protein BH23VER1_BH23VER1_29900 [soil metagenome]